MIKEVFINYCNKNKGWTALRCRSHKTRGEISPASEKTCSTCEFIGNTINGTPLRVKCDHASHPVDIFSQGCSDFLALNSYVTDKCCYSCAHSHTSSKVLNIAGGKKWE